jgi:hypothetical protein
LDASTTHARKPPTKYTSMYLVYIDTVDTCVCTYLNPQNVSCMFLMRGGVVGTIGPSFHSPVQRPKTKDATVVAPNNTIICGLVLPAGNTRMDVRACKCSVSFVHGALYVLFAQTEDSRSQAVLYPYRHHRSHPRWACWSSVQYVQYQPRFRYRQRVRIEALSWQRQLVQRQPRLTRDLMSGRMPNAAPCRSRGPGATAGWLVAATPDQAFSQDNGPKRACELEAHGVGLPKSLGCSTC